MELTLGEKSEIKQLYYNNESEKAVKKLIKMYNKNYNNILDKHFILKNLSLILKKIEDNKENNKDYTICNYYLREALNNIKTINNYESKYSMQYYELVWMDIEINKDTLTNEDKINKYYSLYDYYKKIGYKRNEIGILVNIYKIQNKIEDIPNLIYELIDIRDNDTIDIMKDILQECKTFGDTYYNKALAIIKRETKVGNISIL